MYMVLEDERMPLQSKDARSFETNPQIIHDVIDFTVSWSVGNISDENFV